MTIKTSTSGLVHEVKNPYTNEVVGKVSLLSREEIQSAINKASDFQSTLTPYERYEILRRASDIVLQRKEEIARCITRESGLALRDTLHEVDRTHNVLLLSAEAAKSQEGCVYRSDIVPQRTFRVAFTFREAMGLVLAITPFNHPLNQVAHKVGPAIAMNNTILLKPSMKTPLSAYMLQQLLYEAGLPEKMLTVLSCNIEKHASFLLSHPKIDMIAFTGSTLTGERIMREVGIKKIIMELGGNDACILCEDADLPFLIDIIVWGGLGNSGQRCTSIKRLLCHDRIADRVVTLLRGKIENLKSGDPLDPKTDIGTVIDEQAASLIEKRIQQAVRDGAILVTGGKRIAALVEPTLLDHVTSAMEIVSKETFGPVIPIIRFHSDKEAIEITNDTEYGLQAGVCTQNLRRAMYYAGAIKTGAVHINQSSGYRVESWPFGGIKRSGIGKEGIERACREMSNEKLVSFDFPSSL